MSRFYDLESEIRHAETGEMIRRPLEILVRQDEHHIAGKRLGRHLEHDPASKLFPVDMTGHLDTATFHSALWMPQFDAFDQGELGSCTGNAMGGLLMTGPFYETTHKIAGRDITEEECLELYKHATLLDRIPGEYPPDDTGSSGLAVAKAAKRMGLIGAYRHAFSMRAVLKSLQAGPVLFGFGWYDSFDEPDTDSVVRVLPGAVVRGGHEVLTHTLIIEHLANGDIDEENSYFVCRNSWGPEFGNLGDFKISLKTWRYLMKEYADVTVPGLPVIEAETSPALPSEPESSEV
jgi:hypothetical protein